MEKEITTMIYTSAQASKLLCKLQEEYQNLALTEENSKTFIASVGEDPESVRPEYDYEATRDALSGLQEKIRKLKHAINVFNTQTYVPGFDMTIDEILVYIPQLSGRKGKLTEMAGLLPKARLNGRGMSNVIDYKYVNYDLKQVKADLDAVTEELSKAQLALDEVNHTATLDMEI
jgi:hypothetical protein